MDSPSKMSSMDSLLGLLRIRIKRGVNLAVRDVLTSDPYIVVKMGKQKLKTRVISKDVNPEWNEDLTLSVSDPELPVKLEILLDDPIANFHLFVRCCFTLATKAINPNCDITCLLTVYDHDTFSMDDKMGDAEFDIKPYLNALKMQLKGLPTGTVVSRVHPTRQNSLSEESCIVFQGGHLIQDMCLRLRHVECGEVEIQLQWIDLPGSKGLGSS